MVLITSQKSELALPFFVTSYHFTDTVTKNEGTDAARRPDLISQVRNDFRRVATEASH